MRLLIVLGSDEYVRNYAQTDAFRALRRDHDVHVLLADRCKQDVLGSARFAVDKALEKQHYELFNVLTWRHRRRSRTFRYRFSRFYRTYPNDSLRNVWRNLTGLRSAARYVALGNRVVAPLAIPRMIENIPINPSLECAVAEIAPDLALMPCSAYDPIGNDLVRLGHAQGFRTLFLVDNWDNLSSKSIFWAVPDFLGVWGEQSREHATRIHDIPPDRVSLLGTPRFEGYYAQRTTPAASPYPFPYILFAGVALAFDELSALRRLDAELAAHSEVYGDLKIVYRPHPHRQPRLCPDEFREDDFRHVVLDRQVADAYYQKAAVFPSLDYYPALLANARVVVCPLTTMLIEALVCGTPVLAITYDDGLHYTSPHNAYRYYLHFEGIERIRGLTLAGDPARLGAQLRALVRSPPAVSQAEIDASLRHFLYDDARRYADRLGEVVAKLAR